MTAQLPISTVPIVWRLTKLPTKYHKGALEKNTTYYYSYSNDGTTWSKAEKYQTKDFSSYKIWLVGDRIDYCCSR